MYKKGKGMPEVTPLPVSDEEYELYRYNIPPRYDGSRFRRRREAPSVSTAVSEQDTIHEPEQICEDSECLCDKGGEAENKPHRAEEEHSILSVIGERLGGEELLMIAVALAIAGGDGSGDALLLLLLLLCHDS